jgi:hypothetical protein
MAISGFSVQRELLELKKFLSIYRVHFVKK